MSECRCYCVDNIKCLKPPLRYALYLVNIIGIVLFLLPTKKQLETEKRNAVSSKKNAITTSTRRSVQDVRKLKSAPRSLPRSPVYIPEEAPIYIEDKKKIRSDERFAIPKSESRLSFANPPDLQKYESVEQPFMSKGPYGENMVVSSLPRLEERGESELMRQDNDHEKPYGDQLKLLHSSDDALKTNYRRSSSASHFSVKMDELDKMIKGKMDKINANGGTESFHKIKERRTTVFPKMQPIDEDDESPIRKPDSPGSSPEKNIKTVPSLQLKSGLKKVPSLQLKSDEKKSVLKTSSSLQLKPDEKKSEPKSDTSLQKKSEPKSDTSLDKKSGPKSDTSLQNKSEPKSDTSLQKKSEPKSDTSLQKKSEPKSDTSLQKKSEPKSDTSLQNKSEPKSDTSLQKKSEPKSDTSLQKKSEPKSDTSLQKKSEPKSDTSLQKKSEPKIVSSTQLKSEPKSEPSFETKSDTKSSPSPDHAKSESPLRGPYQDTPVAKSPDKSEERVSKSPSSPDKSVNSSTSVESKRSLHSRSSRKLRKGSSKTSQISNTVGADLEASALSKLIRHELKHVMKYDEEGDPRRKTNTIIQRSETQFLFFHEELIKMKEKVENKLNSIMNTEGPKMSYVKSLGLNFPPILQSKKRTSRSSQTKLSQSRTTQDKSKKDKQKFKERANLSIRNKTSTSNNDVIDSIHYRNYSRLKANKTKNQDQRNNRPIDSWEAISSADSTQYLLESTRVNRRNIEHKERSICSIILSQLECKGDSSLLDQKKSPLVDAPNKSSRKKLRNQKKIKLLKQIFDKLLNLALKNYEDYFRAMLRLKIVKKDLERIYNAIDHNIVNLKSHLAQPGYVHKSEVMKNKSYELISNHDEKLLSNIVKSLHEECTNEEIQNPKTNIPSKVKQAQKSRFSNVHPKMSKRQKYILNKYSKLWKRNYKEMGEYSLNPDTKLRNNKINSKMFKHLWDNHNERSLTNNLTRDIGTLGIQNDSSTILETSIDNKNNKDMGTECQQDKYFNNGPSQVMSGNKTSLLPQENMNTNLEKTINQSCNEQPFLESGSQTMGECQANVVINQKNGTETNESMNVLNQLNSPQNFNCIDERSLEISWTSFPSIKSITSEKKPEIQNLHSPQGVDNFYNNVTNNTGVTSNYKFCFETNKDNIESYSSENRCSKFKKYKHWKNGFDVVLKYSKAPNDLFR